MITVEETEATPNGLDYLIKGHQGNWLAWAYTKEMADLIAAALEEYDADARNEANTAHGVSDDK